MCRRENRIDGVTLGNRIVRGLEKAFKQILKRGRCKSHGYEKNHAKHRKQPVQRPEEKYGHYIHSLTEFPSGSCAYHNS